MRSPTRSAAGGYGRYGVFELPEGVIVRHHERRWIEELTAGLERVALDDIRVQTMTGHDADAFQWLGRTPAGARAREKGAST